MAGTEASESRRQQQPPAIDVPTRHMVRLLMLRGLAPAEATNLTAFLCGIPVADGSWRLGEINQMLFLRELNRRGRFGASDRSRAVIQAPT